MHKKERKFGLTCREVASAMSYKVDHLSLWFKIKMKLHLLVCETCSNYAAHLKLIVKKYKELMEKRRFVTKEAIKELEDKILSALKSRH